MRSCINTRLCMLVAVVLCLSYVQAYDYCSVLHDSLLFYEAQRSGRLPSTNRIPWRGDSALYDATSPNTSRDASGDGNLAGGYYDGGDGIKFAFPLAFTTTTLSWGLIEYVDAVEACGEHNAYLDTIKWATDWLLKAHTAPNEFYGQVGNSELDHPYWGVPENMTMERPAYKIDADNPGTDLAMEVAAALAAASIAFNSTDAAYSATLLRHAREMYTFGATYLGFYHDSIPDAANYYRSYGYDDEIVWASAWMYRATQEDDYLNRAVADYASLSMSARVTGKSFDWDQKTPGVAVLMAKITGDAQYSVDAQRWFASWQPGAMVQYTPGGLAWLRAWGPLRYTAGSAFLALMLSTASGNDWASGQVGYMLGTNPLSSSFVCGHGATPPQNPQHRAAHGSTSNYIDIPVENLHVLTGALVGGPGIADDYVDSRVSINNDVALDFNAAFTAAVAGLAQLAGDSIPATPSPSPTPSSAPTPTPAATPSPTPTPTPTPEATFPPIPTPTPTAPPTLRVLTHPAASVWWFALELVGDVDISLVEIMGATSQTFAPMEATNWGYWVYSPPSELILPLTFRVTLPSKMAMFSFDSIAPGSYVDSGITY